MENNKLQHAGIKGMKWGVRRYQNKDGTLTEAGKKRYNKEMEKLKAEEKVLKNRQKTKAKLDKLEAKKREIEEQKRALDGKPSREQKPAAAKQPSNSPKRKPVGEMTDEELNSVVQRLTNEKKYREFNPEQVSKGKKFVEGMWDKAVQPALQSVAKSQIEKALNSALDGTSKKK